MSKFLFNKVIIFFCVIFTLFSCQHKNYSVKVIVIDPGHGGKDSGAKGINALEKDINLATALKLGFYINKYLPDVKVVYTRSTDNFISLRERAKIANKAKADLFISIHSNAARNKAWIQGTETYVFGKNNEQFDINDLNDNALYAENSVIKLETNYQMEYAGYDYTKPKVIDNGKFQNSVFIYSLRFAQTIENQYKYSLDKTSRGVKENPFLVLKNVKTPAVLTEIGFISNPDDEKYLSSKMGQACIASSIFRAIREYKEEIEGYTDYRIQIGAYKNKVNINEGKWARISNFRTKYENGLYKYILPGFSTEKDAEIAVSNLRASGFEDAFIIYPDNWNN